jgi:hypothetical protein
MLKLSLCLINYASRHEDLYSSTIIYLGIGLRWVVSFTDRQLYLLGKNLTTAVQPLAGRYTDWAMPVHTVVQWIYL